MVMITNPLAIISNVNVSQTSDMHDFQNFKFNMKSGNCFLLANPPLRHTQPCSQPFNFIIVTSLTIQRPENLKFTKITEDLH